MFYHRNHWVLTDLQQVYNSVAFCVSNLRISLVALGVSYLRFAVVALRVATSASLS